MLSSIIIFCITGLIMICYILNGDIKYYKRKQNEYMSLYDIKVKELNQYIKENNEQTIEIEEHKNKYDDLIKQGKTNINTINLMQDTLQTREAQIILFQEKLDTIRKVLDS